MRRARMFAGVSLGVLALICATAPSAASAAPAPVVGTHVAKSAQAIAAYWTPDRMRRAIPGDQRIASKFGKARTGKQVAKGKPAAIAATGPLTPIAHIGKVFMTIDGSDYVCSGNSITSGNRDVVATAGHCVNDGDGGSWVSNFEFVPAYDNGSAPYGEWAARTVYTTSAWANNGDFDYDTGFAVMNTLNGQHLNNAVGSSGVAFNQARGKSYTLYGYPAASPFNGQSLYSCAGVARQDNQGSQDQGVSCNMTGGSSGGPWFIGSGSGGLQNSINSFGYNNVANVMWGPYWGSTIQSVYNQASAA